MNTNTYTLKTNPAKYDNLHKVDQKYWKFSCDFSQAQSADVLKSALNDTALLLKSILESKAFKPENVAAAKELGSLLVEQSKTLFADGADMNVSTFIVYQFQRWAFRIWYRDTKAARDAAKPKTEAPAKQEKKPAAKKPAAKKPAAKKPAAKKPAAKKAPAKQDIAEANEATFVSKLTKAQKKELLLTLMTELLK